MTRFMVDSWIWIEYLNGTEKGLKLKEFIEKEENEFFTSIVSLAEILSVAKRKNMNVGTAENAVVTYSQIMDIDVTIAKEAGLFHGEMKKKISDFGLGDAFVIISARKLNAKILTGDPHFKNIKEAIFIR